jgi:hypothetical protein
MGLVNGKGPGDFCFSRKAEASLLPCPGGFNGTGPQALARGPALPRSGDAENDRECERAEGHHAADDHAQHEIPLPAAVVYDGALVISIY